MGCKMRAAQTMYGDEVGGAIVPVEEGDFITELAREVLQGAELDDLQSLFADEMNISNSPMGCPTETSPLMVPVLPSSQTWDEWLRQHSKGDSKPCSRRSNKQRNMTLPGQLSIWGNSPDG
jgi:hypothetical protein